MPRRLPLTLGALFGVVVCSVAAGQTFSEFVIPTANSSPDGIAAGPDGALWFTENSVASERRLTLEGGGEGTYDLGAYGLTGEYVIELVGSQKYEASVSETRRPSPREVRR